MENKKYSQKFESTEIVKTRIILVHTNFVSVYYKADECKYRGDREETRRNRQDATHTPKFMQKRDVNQQIANLFFIQFVEIEKISTNGRRICM